MLFTRVVQGRREEGASQRGNGTVRGMSTGTSNSGSSGKLRSCIETWEVLEHGAKVLLVSSHDSAGQSDNGRSGSVANRSSRFAVWNSGNSRSRRVSLGLDDQRIHLEAANCGRILGSLYLREVGDGDEIVPCFAGCASY